VEEEEEEEEDGWDGGTGGGRGLASADEFDAPPREEACDTSSITEPRGLPCAQTSSSPFLSLSFSLSLSPSLCRPAFSGVKGVKISVSAGRNSCRRDGANETDERSAERNDP